MNPVPVISNAAVFLLVFSAMVSITSGSEVSQAGTPVPVIDDQPTAIAASSNAPAAFSVTAHGVGPLDYQWWKDGQRLTNTARISGATSSVLSISSLQFFDSGGYAAVVTNAGGAVTSAIVSLTVTQPAIAVLPLGATGALVSVRGPIGDVYRIELSIDFGSWLTNGYATNFNGIATFTHQNTGGTFKNFRPVCERILPILYPARGDDAQRTVRAYGKLNEVWKVEGTTNFLHWDSIVTVTNLAGWTKINDTNTPAPPHRFYRISPP